MKINLKEVDWEWQRIATGVGMIGVAVAAGHAFARWWMRRIEGGVTWKAKWTVCAAMMMGLFAISAISVAGIAHQVAWLRG
ncbi:MAG: hypothetical protein KDK99_17920, partial [Verrucomicrobiales bacterium]|nr:hypothetical protein [Verrucomicrobiales bacterium]